VRAAASLCTALTPLQGGTSALHLAARQGHAPAVDALISAGAVVSATDAVRAAPLRFLAQLRERHEAFVRVQNGDTPLRLAERRSRAAVIELLESAAEEEDDDEGDESARGGTVRWCADAASGLSAISNARAY
jgi:ankyrin repeat protein